jgi:hypothetical protein
MFGPPSDMDALVSAQDTAPTRALIVTLGTNPVLSVMGFISHGQYGSLTFLLSRRQFWQAD